MLSQIVHFYFHYLSKYLEKVSSFSAADLDPKLLYGACPFAHDYAGSYQHCFPLSCLYMTLQTMLLVSCN